MEEKTYYVYRHIRLDTGQPFYIGVGSKKPGFHYSSPKREYARAYAITKDRNKHWKNIYKKVGRAVEILDDNLSREEAFSKEIWFISLYGRVDIGTGILCNWTDGGEGPKGAKRTPAQIDALKEALKKRPKPTFETIERVRLSLLETIAREIRCVETGKIFKGRIAVRDEMFPTHKNAHRNIDNACRNGRPYKGFHFEYADEPRESLYSRGKLGDNQKNAKLSSTQVSEIKHDYNNGASVKELSKKFAVTSSAISAILRGLTWAWVLPQVVREVPKQRRLQPLEVIEIKNLLRAGESTVEIGRLFGVCYTVIQKIQSGKSHKNIGGTVPKGCVGKLNAEQRNEIKKQYGKYNSYELARIYGVNASTIQRIVSGKTWANG